MSDLSDVDDGDGADDAVTQRRWTPAISEAFYTDCAETLANWSQEHDHVAITEQELRQRLKDFMLDGFHMLITDKNITDRLRAAATYEASSAPGRERHAEQRMRWEEGLHRWTGAQRARKLERAERASRLRRRPRAEPVSDDEEYGVPCPMLRETSLQRAMLYCAQTYAVVRDGFKAARKERSKAATSERKEQRQQQRRAERREQLIQSLPFNSLAQAAEAVERDVAVGDSAGSSSSSSTPRRRFNSAAVTVIYSDYLAQQSASQQALAEELMQSARRLEAATAEYRAEKQQLTEAYRRQKLALLAHDKENVSPNL